MHEIVDDEGAWGDAVDRVPAYRDALAALGFRCLGLTGLREPQGAENVYAGEDEAIGVRFRFGQACEIWVSPDERAIAVPATFVAGPVLSLLSARPDGRVVETTTRPVRPPILRDPGPTPPALWHRETSERAGLDVALIDTRDVAALWAAHRQRLGDAELPSHASLPFAAAIQRAMLDRAVNAGVRAYLAGALIVGVVQASLWLLLALAVGLAASGRVGAGAGLALAAVATRWLVPTLRRVVHGATRRWANRGAWRPAPIVVPAFTLRRWPAGLVPALEEDG